MFNNTRWLNLKARTTKKIYNSKYSFLIPLYKREQYLFRSVVLGALYADGMLSIMDLPDNCVFLKKFNYLFFPNLLTRTKWNSFKKTNSILTKEGRYYVTPIEGKDSFEYSRDSETITTITCHQFFQQNTTPQLSKLIKKWNTFMRLRTD